MSHTPLEAITNEFCSFNTALMRVRRLVTDREEKHEELLSQWSNDFRTALDKISNFSKLE
jgi:hypothetical protein